MNFSVEISVLLNNLPLFFNYLYITEIYGLKVETCFAYHKFQTINNTFN